MNPPCEISDNHKLWCVLGLVYMHQHGVHACVDIMSNTKHPCIQKHGGKMTPHCLSMILQVSPSKSDGFWEGSFWHSRVQNEWSSGFGLLTSTHFLETQVFGLKLKLVKWRVCLLCCVQNFKALWGNVHVLVGWVQLDTSQPPTKFWPSLGVFPQDITPTPPRTSTPKPHVGHGGSPSCSCGGWL